MNFADTLKLKDIRTSLSYMHCPLANLLNHEVAVLDVEIESLMEYVTIVYDRASFGNCATLENQTNDLSI